MDDPPAVSAYKTAQVTWVSLTVSFIKKPNLKGVEGVCVIKHKLRAGSAGEAPDNLFYCWKLEEPRVSLQSESKVLCWDDMVL